MAVREGTMTRARQQADRGVTVLSGDTHDAVALNPDRRRTALRYPFSRLLPGEGERQQRRDVDHRW